MKILLLFVFVFAVQLQSQTHLKILYNDGNDELIEINAIEKMTLTQIIDQIIFHYVSGDIISKNTAEIKNITLITVSIRQKLQDIIELVNVLPLNDGIKVALQTKINLAISKYNQGQFNVVINILNAFINQVNDLITEGKLTEEEGQPLIDYANLVLDVIYSGIPKPSADEKKEPLQYELTQNYPNPFNPSTTISYSLPQDGFIRITVYDVLGNEISKLVNDYEKAGRYSVQFDGKNLSSGVYLCRFVSGNYNSTIKMFLVK